MAAVLVDTNVLVYAHDRGEPAKQQQAMRVLDALEITGEGRLTAMVVQAVLSYPEYEELIRQRALDAHRDLVIALGQEADRQGLTEQQLAAELEDDKRQLFKEWYGRKPSAKR